MGVPKCVVCDEEVKVRGRYDQFFQLKTGWVKKRTSGGANALHEPVKAHPQFCHVNCIGKLKPKKGQVTGQVAMFDE